MMLRLLAATLALSIATPTLAQSATTPAATTVQMPHISVEAIGQGAPVILIPGLASPRGVWDDIAPTLAKDHRVYLVQVNGFGGDDPRANLQGGVLDGMVAELARFIAEQKLVKPAVIGHSMGGLAAMKLAAAHPDSVGRLMVVDALPFIGPVLAPGSTAETIRPRADMMRTAIAGTHGQSRPEVTADPGGIWSITPAGRIRVANWGRLADLRVVAQAMYDDMVTDATADLPKITARPFIVLYATGAGPMAKAIWERAYDGSSATLEPVADSYHFIMLDQPKAFAAAVERFLR